ncbi:hypothetical protein EMEDMD4_1170020 [Sinorhizobium medicae]|uniref:Cytochrome P450 n=1 Tax=Sinorhizobium medicae TaxID=110321 RepID=A0A508WVH8_9HYPH|nr:hypothetical protein EMEDMD4_1170020 [Sinorhizobium medicae]
MLDCRRLVRSAPFRRPGNLRLGREEKPHLAFSHGPYYCIGVEPAGLELKVAFGSIFQRFPALPGRGAKRTEVAHAQHGLGLLLTCA